MSDEGGVIIPDWPPEPEEFWTIVLMRNPDSSFYYKLVPGDATRGPIESIHELEAWAEWVNARIDPITISSVDGLQGALDSKATQGDIVAAINVVIGGAPSNMDTLGEIAARIISDEAALAALSTVVAGKEPVITAGLTTQVWQGDKTWIDKLGLPISNAAQAALDLKAPLASPTFTGTVSGVTKAMVGLGAVDNTSDANKIVSGPQQTALNAKENTVTAGVSTQYYQGDKTWQDKSALPISTPTQTALDGKMSATPTVSTPTRTIGSAGFQVSTTRPALVSYTIKTQATNPAVAGSSTATVQLLVDAATTPTTERGRVEATSSVGLAVAIAITTSNTATLTYLVPAAHYVRLVGATSNGGTNTLVAQVEEVL